MLVKTEAIVLKSIKYRSTSKIVSFYSKEFGKLKGIAKGARDIKNKFGSALEPLSYSMLVIYKKEHRELHLISQCDTIYSFKNLFKVLDKLLIGLDIAGLVDAVTHDEDKNLKLFELLLDTLKSLDESEKNFKSFLHAFELHLAEIFGYSPNLNTCSMCGKAMTSLDKEKDIVFFRIDRGAVLCNICHKKVDDKSSYKTSSLTLISPQTLLYAQKLVKEAITSLSNIEYDEKVSEETGGLIKSYLNYHFGNLRSINLEYY